MPKYTVDSYISNVGSNRSAGRGGCRQWFRVVADGRTVEKGFAKRDAAQRFADKRNAAEDGGKAFASFESYGARGAKN